jgi:hypothetical protein
MQHLEMLALGATLYKNLDEMSDKIGSGSNATRRVGFGCDDEDVGLEMQVGGRCNANPGS